jgi:hypothetical protein
MRVLLIHNPKAGDGKHSKKQLMASLTRFGHQAFYQSIKERGWRKAFEKPVDLVIAAGGDGTVHRTAWQIMDAEFRWQFCPWVRRTTWRTVSGSPDLLTKFFNPFTAEKASHSTSA